MTEATDDVPRRRWMRRAGVGAVLVLFAIELAVGWPSLVAALRELHMPRIGWLALVVLAEVAAMSAYARMQRHLLRSAGVRSSHRDNVRLVYAAHSLNETLPGGPAFSTRLNFRQLRLFGAGPAVASWVIALSGLLSTVALGVITAGGALASGGATHWLRLSGLLAVAAAIAFGVRHIAAHPGTAEALISRPLAVVNRLRRHPEQQGRDRIAVFVSQLRAARLRPADGVAVIAYALVNWLLDAAGLWLCFYAVGGHPPTATAVLLAFCAAMAAGSVTIVPGGLGIVDSALVLGLGLGGVPLPVAVAVVVLYRIVSLGFIIGLGWLFWFQLRARPAAAPTPRATPSLSRPRTDLRRLAVCPHRSTAYGEPPRPRVTRGRGEAGRPSGGGQGVHAGGQGRGEDTGVVA
ncbi:lysylphosphatidylglycerol synthase transmembrane domain-containing protein [Micromonosporaceae bacterium Da 78-11]